MKALFKCQHDLEIVVRLTQMASTRVYDTRSLVHIHTIGFQKNIVNFFYIT